ncbi:MAG: PAS domain-containing protein [Thermodesulfobacteriota bacterium]
MNSKISPNKNPFLKDKYIKNLLKNFAAADSVSAMPMACTCSTDLKGTITDISPEFLTVVETERDQAIGKPLANFLTKDKPSGTLINFKDITEDPNLSSADHQICIKSQNKFINSKLNINKTYTNSINTGFLFIFSSINISPNKNDQTTQNIHKDAILQSIIFASENIIQSAGNISETMLYEILRHLGISTRSNRILIFENTINDYGSNLMNLKYEWFSPNLFPIKPDSALKKYRYTDKVFKILSNGDAYQKKVNDLSEPDELLLKDHLIKSFILIPVFSRDRFYGTLAVADCEKPRIWSQDEKDGLKVSARLIGQIINKIISTTKIPAFDKSILNQSNAEPTCIIDNTSKMIFTSTGFENLIGYSSAETNNIPVTAFVYSEKNSFRKTLKNIFFTKKSVSDTKIKIRTSKDTWIPVFADMFFIDTSETEAGLIQINIKESIKMDSKNEILKDNHNFNTDTDILDNFIDPVWVTDKNNRFVYANKSFYTNIFSGYPDVNLIGKTAEELPDKLNFLVKLIASDLKNNDEAIIEKQNNSKKKIYKIQKTNLSNKESKLTGCLWSATNQTELTDLKNKLKNTEKMYSSIFENFPGAVFLKNSKGEYIYKNNYMKDFINISSKKSSNNKPFPDYLISKFTMEDLKVLRENKIETIESFPEICGSSNIFKKIKFPVYSQYGESLIGGIAVDITGEKKAEEKLRQAEDKFEEDKIQYREKYEQDLRKNKARLGVTLKTLHKSRTLLGQHLNFFHNAPLLFFMCSLSGKIIKTNKKGKDLTSLRLADFKGKNIDSLLDLETRKRLYSLWRNLLAKIEKSGSFKGVIQADKSAFEAIFFMSLTDENSKNSLPGIILIALPCTDQHT